MRRVAQVISGLALVGTVLPPLLFLGDRLALDRAQAAMLVATFVWFIATPLWMEHRAKD